MKTPKLIVLIVAVLTASLAGPAQAEVVDHAVDYEDEAPPGLNLAGDLTEVDEDWVFEGGGWGHGVGLSQFGAYGMALDGAGVDEIIGHYYSGAVRSDLATELGADHWLVTDPTPFMIGLDQSQTAVDVEAIGGPVAVCQPAEGETTCDSPPEIAAGETWGVSVVEGSDPLQCVLTSPASPPPATPGTCSIDFTWIDDGGVTRIGITGNEYAHGTVHLRLAGSALHVTLEIGVEDYIAGIAEVPSSWPESALQTQAVIARSYAIRQALNRVDDAGNLTADRLEVCGCHLYDTVSDQVYAGWEKEGDPDSGDDWVAAGSATAGQIVTHPDAGIISTYYSSSTGGATENVEDVWGNEPSSYLRSVDDHWAVEPEVNNFYDAWTIATPEDTLLGILGWDYLLDIEVIDPPPGAVVRFTGQDAGLKVTADYGGDALRTTFDLLSPWVEGVIKPYPFVDIGASIHKDDIDFIAELGITKGCNPPTNDLFCPTGTVTRGQMAAFITRALGLAATTGPDRFVDDDNSVFEDDIERLAAAGITKGCNPPANDRFCPGEPVTRGQMAAFLVRAFRYSEPATTDFVDDDLSIFEADIEKLAAVGVTKGCNPPANDRFCPDYAVTREQMASFIARALQEDG